MEPTAQLQGENAAELQKPESKSKKRPFWLRSLRFLFKAGLYFFVFSLLLTVLLKWCPVFFTPLMLIRKAEAYWQGKDTQIYYEWANYARLGNQAPVAAVASEDQKFPVHWGFDIEAIQQARQANLQGGRLVGASTISQQVAKNVFLWPGRNYVRKALEAYFTLLIEVIWGKERILEVYLNIAETGPMTFGIQAASKRFLNKPAELLQAGEAASIIAVLPNPRVYSVKNPSYYLLSRRNQIVYQMRMLGGATYLQNLRKF